MTEKTSYRNKVPTFMMGPIHDASLDPKEDSWQNVMGAYPSTKTGITQYCTAILGLDINDLPAPTPFIMYSDKVYSKEEDKKKRKDKMVYGRVPYDKMKSMYRMRTSDTKDPIFGSYSDDVDGISNEMKRHCQLCSQYGYPAEKTRPDDICKSGEIPFVWNLKRSLYDKKFNDFITPVTIAQERASVTVEMNFGLGTNLSTQVESQIDQVEVLVGMQLTPGNVGQMLPYDRRPCKGDLQNLPVGIPGKFALYSVFLLHMLTIMIRYL